MSHSDFSSFLMLWSRKFFLMSSSRDINSMSSTCNVFLIQTRKSHWSGFINILCSYWLWPLCRERIYYRRWRQQYNDCTHDRLFLCLPTYHSVFIWISDISSAALYNISRPELRGIQGCLCHSLSLVWTVSSSLSPIPQSPCVPDKKKIFWETWKYFRPGS